MGFHGFLSFPDSTGFHGFFGFPGSMGFLASHGFHGFMGFPGSMVSRVPMVSLVPWFLGFHLVPMGFHCF